MSTTELLDQPTQQLPESNGDLTRWHQDMATMQELRQHPQGYEFEAQLPEIVGWMSQEEAAIMAGWDIPNDSSHKGRYLWFGSIASKYSPLDNLRKELPNLMKTVDDDLRTLFEDGRVDYAEFDRAPLSTSDPVRGGGGLHIDGVGPDRVTYLVADIEPTLFYQGPAELKLLQNVETGEYGDWPKLVSPAGLADGTAGSIQAPPLAIVRMSTATVHGSPIPKAEGIRNWLRILTNRGDAV